MEKLLKQLGMTEKEAKTILLGKKSTKQKLINKHFKGETFKIGVVSDTHLCSKYEQLDQLHTFYKLCEEKGVKAVLNAGDILDGWKIYRGQENEIHTFGADNQINYVVKNYPKFNGKTYFINGNHDLSWMTLAGINPGEKISEKRDDMICLGDFNSMVTLNDVRFMLHHGEGGSAYALSYKPQKMAEQIASGHKPHILLFGHWHVCNYFFYRNMHILTCGAFQGQTPYILRKGINPAVGGWILEITVNEGEVVAISPTWIPFY